MTTTTPLRVLLVDDEASLRDPLTKFLHSQYGYYVDAVSTGDEALEQLRVAGGKYDVALVDAVLTGGMSGLEVLHEIKEHYSDIEVIVFTGWGLESGLEALRAGAYRYFAKSGNYDELALTIHFAAEQGQSRRERRMLAALQQVSTAINSAFDMDEVLHLTCQAAVELFGVDHSGLVKFEPDYSAGKVIAEYPDRETEGIKRTLGTIIPVHGVLAEERLAHQKEVLNIPDVAIETALGPVRDVLLSFGIRSILVVPVVTQDRTIASFSLDTIREIHTFSSSEVEFCKSLANQVAIAIDKAHLLQETKQRAEQLAALRQTTLAVTSQLERKPLLTTIIEQAVKLLQAKSGGIYEYHPERGELTIVADHSRPTTVLGNTLKVGEGMAGRLVQSGEPCLIVDDYNIWPGKAAIFADERPFGAVLEVPLKWQEKIIGVLYIDDEVGRKFTEEDAHWLSLFADQAAIALVNAELVDKKAELIGQLGAQKDYVSRLIASSPIGIVANDVQGNVIQFNECAREILGYTAEEALGTHVARLYDDPDEARRIGKLLHQMTDGKLKYCETVIRTKGGERVPVRVSLTWLYGAKKNRIGCVGCFEDLRAIKDTEQRLELLLKASNTVASDENLTGGMQNLAEMMVSHLRHTFCRILLLDESGQFLAVKAACSIPQPGRTLNWEPRLEQRVVFSDWPGLDALLRREKPTILKLTDQRVRDDLIRFSRFLNLDNDIQSLLMIPLKIGAKVVGLLDLGELRSEERSQFTSQEIELANAIAAQTAILIDRMLRYEDTRRREQLLSKLDEASRHIRAVTETPKLLQEVVRLAAELVGCTAGGLYLNRPHLRQLELSETYELPHELIRGQLTHNDGIVGQVASTGEPQTVAERSDQSENEAIIEPSQFKIVAAIPLKQAGEVEAVLFVADDTSRKPITRTDLEILERFAAQAAIALLTSRLMGQELRRFAQLELLHKISDYIQTSRDLENILRTILTGVTAGYGLGFNRAAVLFLDERAESLVGSMGIGYLDEKEAREDWAQSAQSGLDDFKRYLELLEQNTLSPTPMDKRIRELRLAVAAGEADAFARAVSHGQCILVNEYSKLPENFVKAFEPALPLVVIPLLARGEVIGLLVADNKFTRAPVTPEDTELLLTFTNTAAAAINNLQLLQETEKSRETLRSSYKASNALVSSRPPRQVAQEIVEQVCTTTGASGVSMILFDDLNHVRDMITAGKDSNTTITDLAALVRPEGLSVQIIRTGKREIIEDVSTERNRVNPSLFARGIAAMLGLPVSVEGARIGVMWVHYEHSRRFSNSEIDALELYVNQAAVALGNAMLLNQISTVKRAAEAVAHVTVLENLDATLTLVAQETQKATRCDAVTLYVYKQVTNELSHPPKMVGVRHPERAKRYGRVLPSAFVYTVLECNEPITVENVSEDALFKNSRFTQDEEIESCVALSLKAADQKVGVMFVNYRSHHRFRNDELASIELLANQAAIAIRNAHLYEQVENRARLLDAASQVAHSASGILNENELLNDAVRRITDCFSSYGVYHAGVFLLDEEKKFAILQAASSEGGRRMLERDHKLEVGKQGIVGLVTKTGKPRLTSDVRQDPHHHANPDLPDSRSEMAFPLLARGQVIGALDVQSTEVLTLQQEDIATFQTMTDKLANAISNAQLYKQAIERLNEANALQQVAISLAGATGLHDVLNLVMREAMRLTNTHEGNILFWDAQVKKFTQTLITDENGELQPYSSHVRDEGFTRAIIDKKSPVMVADTGLEPRANRAFVEKGYKSALGVPLLHEGIPIGVLCVRSKQPRQYSDRQIALTETLASQAAVAIDRARQYEELRRTYEDLKQTKGLISARTTLAWMGLATNHWRHIIEGHAINIRNLVTLLHKELAGTNIGQELLRNLEEKLAHIESLALKIEEKPITPPLSSEEGVTDVSINSLIRERLQQLWQNEPYKSVRLEIKLEAGDFITVTVSSEWLRRALDILIDNAIEELRAVVPARCLISVGTRLANKGLEVYVADTGRGISGEIKEQLFKKRVEKASNSKGLGMGLLIAQAIVETYSGKIYIGNQEVEGSGTVMVIWLPLNTH
jgi:PAS domain S-box-containing protein